MTPEQKAWLAALRSGTYKQTIGTLRRDDGYCCLGVACELHDPTKWELTTCPKEGWEYWSEDPTRVIEDDGEYGSSEQIDPDKGVVELSPYMLEWLGLTDEGHRLLASMNDNGKSFEHIADVVEKNAARFFRGILT